MKQANEYKPGDKVYVRTSLYISHGEDDFQGGIATIKYILNNAEGKPAYFAICERPGTEYNIGQLDPETQEKLKADYGDRIAHPDPDYGTPASERW